MLRLYHNLRKSSIILDDEDDIPNLNLLIYKTEGLIKISYETLNIISVSTISVITQLICRVIVLHSANPVPRILITCTYYRPTPSGGEGMYSICFCVTSCNSLSCAAANHQILLSLTHTSKPENKFNIYLLLKTPTQLKNVYFDVKFDCDECFVTSEDNMKHPSIHKTY